MDENKEQMEKKMDQRLEKLEQKIIPALDRRLPKINNMTKVTQETKGSIQVKQLSTNNIFSS